MYSKSKSKYVFDLNETPYKNVLAPR